MALAMFDIMPRAPTQQLPAGCRVSVTNAGHSFAQTYYKENADEITAAHFYSQKANQKFNSSRSLPDNVLHNPAFMKTNAPPQAQQQWAWYNRTVTPISYRFQTRQFPAGPHKSSSEVYAPCVFGRDMYAINKDRQAVSTAEAMDLYNGVHFGEQQGFVGLDTHS